MNQPQLPSEEEMEARKREIGLDEEISKIWDVPVCRVRSECNPRLLQFILFYLKQKREGSQK